MKPTAKDVEEEFVGRRLFVPTEALNECYRLIEGVEGIEFGEGLLQFFCVAAEQFALEEETVTYRYRLTDIRYS